MVSMVFTTGLDWGPDSADIRMSPGRNGWMMNECFSIEMMIVKVSLHSTAVPARWSWAWCTKIEEGGVTSQLAIYRRSG